MGKFSLNILFLLPIWTTYYQYVKFLLTNYFKSGKEKKTQVRKHHISQASNTINCKMSVIPKSSRYLQRILQSRKKVSGHIHLIVMTKDRYKYLYDKI